LRSPVWRIRWRVPRLFAGHSALLAPGLGDTLAACHSGEIAQSRRIGRAVGQREPPGRGDAGSVQLVLQYGGRDSLWSTADASPTRRGTRGREEGRGRIQDTIERRGVYLTGSSACGVSNNERRSTERRDRGVRLVCRAQHAHGASQESSGALRSSASGLPQLGLTAGAIPLPNSHNGESIGLHSIAHKVSGLLARSARTSIWFP